MWSGSDEGYYRKGAQHREGGPADIEISPDGTRTEWYCRDGDLHREDGPAHIIIGADGTRTEECYCNGTRRKDLEPPGQQ